MKKTLLTFVVVMCCAVVSMAQEIEFEAMEINYGTIENGSNGVRVFKFKNTGDAPLIIESAKGSCGCTVPTYSREPVAPGETGEIEVRYDTKRTGSFTKSVTLNTNASEEPVRLKIYGVVNAPKSDG